MVTKRMQVLSRDKPEIMVTGGFIGSDWNERVFSNEICRYCLGNIERNQIARRYSTAAGPVPVPGAMERRKYEYRFVCMTCWHSARTYTLTEDTEMGTNAHDLEADGYKKHNRKPTRGSTKKHGGMFVTVMKGGAALYFSAESMRVAGFEHGQYVDAFVKGKTVVLIPGDSYFLTCERKNRVCSALSLHGTDIISALDLNEGSVYEVNAEAGMITIHSDKPLWEEYD